MSDTLDSRLRGNDKWGLKTILMNEANQDSVVNELPTLSEGLRAWRGSARMSVEQVARQLSIKPEIILAFEQGNYGLFPARVYAAGYLKRMIEHYSIPEGAQLLDALKTEWEEKRGVSASTYALPHSGHQIWYITPRRLFGSVGAIALIFFAWFLTRQLMGFTGAPTLRIDEPRQNAVSAVQVIRVRGVTEKESQLTVNGREITMNGNGAFDQEIELASGLNTLRFLTQNRFGKIAEETKYVVVK